MIKHPFFNFTIKAIVLLTMAFLLHIAILNAISAPMLDNKIVLSYMINLVLIIFIFGMLYVSKDKFKAQLGFLFLAGSLVKFAIFFIIFHPLYKQDGVVSRLEFASFFIPYVLGLVLETLSLSKWLNQID